ncbi:hypothetical protein F4703DRAFT_1307312 [Phycomyces blakesleeanus]
MYRLWLPSVLPLLFLYISIQTSFTFYYLYSFFSSLLSSTIDLDFFVNPFSFLSPPFFLYSFLYSFSFSFSFSFYLCRIFYLIFISFHFIFFHFLSFPLNKSIYIFLF